MKEALKEVWGALRNDWWWRYYGWVQLTSYAALVIAWAYDPGSTVLAFLTGAEVVVISFSIYVSVTLANERVLANVLRNALRDRDREGYDKTVRIKQLNDKIHRMQKHRTEAYEREERR